MIRALVAEDSPTARRLLVSLLESDGDVSVVGEAATGLEAVALAARLRPEVITMDLHMPELDGIEATRQIMVQAPAPIVIVSSSLADEEIAVSMRALEAGALSAIDKPVGPGTPGFEELRARFLETVKAMAAVKVVRRWSPGQLRPPARLLAPVVHGIEVVGIAASTGGPGALHRLLASIPRPFPAPILVVQHMATGFMHGLAAWLRSVTAHEVVLARSGERLLPGVVYVGPDGHHLTLADRDVVSLSSAPPIDGFRPSATPLFESIGRLYGRTAVGIILTGMGEDGVQGLRTLYSAGGRVIAQDEDSSVVFGMPAAAIRQKIASEILPLDEIGPRLAVLARGGGGR